MPLVDRVPLDYGPIYKETLYGRWPVEPYNTVTTLLFLLVVLYWAWKIGRNYREHILIAIVLPVIGMGFIGGFLYHSLRDNYAWLLLDWVPIIIAANIAAVYFWRTFIKSWILAFLLTYSPLVVIHIFIRTTKMDINFLSVSYSVLAISVIMPILLYVFSKSRPGISRFIYAIICVVAAIALRTLDRNQMMDFLPMGSHFLWHTFGALTCYFLIGYVYAQKPQLKGR